MFFVLNKFFVLNSIMFKSISQQEKMKLMEEKLDRTLYKYIDQWSDVKLKELIDLYKNPLSYFYKHIICKTALFIGRSKFKSVWYRFFKVTV